MIDVEAMDGALENIPHDRLVDAISRLLEGADVHILDLRDGSAKILLALPPDLAERLFWEIKSGALAAIGLGVREIQFLSKATADAMLASKEKRDQYDVFLCHNAADKKEVRQVARELTNFAFLPRTTRGTRASRSLKTPRIMTVSSTRKARSDRTPGSRSGRTRSGRQDGVTEGVERRSMCPPRLRRRPTRCRSPRSSLGSPLPPGDGCARRAHGRVARTRRGCIGVWESPRLCSWLHST